MENSRETVLTAAFVIPENGVRDSTISFWLDKVIGLYPNLKKIYISLEFVQKNKVKYWAKTQGISCIIGDQLVAFCQENDPDKAVICFFSSRNKAPFIYAGILAKAARCDRHVVSPM